MRILYWVTGVTGGGTINFSITGEGSIEEECRLNAESKIDAEVPLKITNIQMQKFYSTKELDEN